MISRDSGRFRSRARLRLEVFRCANHGLSSSCPGLEALTCTSRRDRQGRERLSTLMTSAPRSPRILVVIEPTRAQEKSSTRIPDKGPRRSAACCGRPPGAPGRSGAHSCKAHRHFDLAACGPRSPAPAGADHAAHPAGVASTQALIPRLRPSCFHLLAGATGEECADRLFPLRPSLGIKRRAVVSQPLHAVQGIVGADLIHPVGKGLVGGCAEAPGHERVEAPPIAQAPDAAHGALAVIDRPAHPLELALIELPYQHATDGAAERHFLGRDVHVLSRTAGQRGGSAPPSPRRRRPCPHERGRHRALPSPAADPARRSGATCRPSPTPPAHCRASASADRGCRRP